MKISQRVSEILSGYEIMTDRLTDGWTDRQMDGQAENYRASADFVWRGPNELLLRELFLQVFYFCGFIKSAENKIADTLTSYHYMYT